MPDRIEQVVVRRAPRLGMFIFGGVALGFIAAIVLVVAVPGGQGYDRTQALLYVGVLAGTVGGLLGAAVALWFEWRSRRRMRSAAAEVTEATDSSESDGQPVGSAGAPASTDLPARNNPENRGNPPGQHPTSTPPPTHTTKTLHIHDRST